jgi:hypothetical protein
VTPYGVHPCPSQSCKKQGEGEEPILPRRWGSLICRRGLGPLDPRKGWAGTSLLGKGQTQSPSSPYSVTFAGRGCEVEELLLGPGEAHHQRLPRGDRKALCVPNRQLQVDFWTGRLR